MTQRMSIIASSFSIITFVLSMYTFRLLIGCIFINTHNCPNTMGLYTIVRAVPRLRG